MCSSDLSPGSREMANMATSLLRYCATPLRKISCHNILNAFLGFQRDPDREGTFSFPTLRPGKRGEKRTDIYTVRFSPRFPAGLMGGHRRSDRPLLFLERKSKQKELYARVLTWVGITGLGGPKVPLWGIGGLGRGPIVARGSGAFWVRRFCVILDLQSID